MAVRIPVIGPSVPRTSPGIAHRGVVVHLRLESSEIGSACVLCDGYIHLMGLPLATVRSGYLLWSISCAGNDSSKKPRSPCLYLCLLPGPVRDC